MTRTTTAQPAGQQASQPASQQASRQASQQKMLSIALIGQKGGIGKTSTTIHLAAAFADAGQRVLVVDTDPQGHCAAYLGVDRGGGLRHVMLRTKQNDDDESRRAAPTADFITRSVRPNLDLIAADPSASGAALRISGEAMRELRLKRRLAEVQGDYDLCFIDVSPTVDLLSTMALLAADAALILATPGMPDVSLKDVSLRLRHLYEEAGDGPEVWGIVPNLIDNRENLARELPDRLAQMGGEVAPSVPKGVKVSEANKKGLTITEYLAQPENKKDAKHPIGAAYAPLIEWLTAKVNA